MRADIRGSGKRHRSFIDFMIKSNPHLYEIVIATLLIAGCHHDSSKIRGPIASVSDGGASPPSGFIDASAPISIALDAGNDDGRVPNFCDAHYPKVGQAWVEQASFQTVIEKRVDPNGGCGSISDADADRTIEKRIEAIDGDVVTKLQLREHYRLDDSRIVSSLELVGGHVNVRWDGRDAGADAEISRLRLLAPEVGIAEPFTTILPLPHEGRSGKLEAFAIAPSDWPSDLFAFVLVTRFALEDGTYRVSDGGMVKEWWGEAHLLRVHVDTMSGSASQGCESETTVMNLEGDIELRASDNAFVSARLQGATIYRHGRSRVIREKSGDSHCGNDEIPIQCRARVTRSIERKCF